MKNGGACVLLGGIEKGDVRGELEGGFVGNGSVGREMKMMRLLFLSLVDDEIPGVTQQCHQDFVKHILVADDDDDETPKGREA